MAVQSIRGKIRTMSILGYADKSEIKTESNVPIRWDEDRSVNYINLSRIPRGGIISCVITYFNDAENSVIDGLFNIVGSKIEFLPEENLSGNLAEVKYLI